MVWPERRAFRDGGRHAAAVATELLAGPLRAWARSRVPGSAAPRREWRRGLLIGANHIGDLLYLTPSLGALHAALPDCAWDVAALDPAAEVLAGQPGVAGTVPLAHDRTAAEEREWLSGSGRQSRYDVVFSYNRGAQARDLSLAIRMGVRARVGFGHKGFSAWLTHRVPWPGPCPHAEMFACAVAWLTEQPMNWELRPVVHPRAEDEARASEVAERLGWPGAERVAAVFTSTRQKAAVTWRPERFAEVAARLAAGGWRVALMGGLDERDKLEAIRDRFAPGVPVIAGELGLRALGCLLRRARVVLTPDTGPRHLANAAGCRVCFLRNLGAAAVETGKYLGTETDLTAGLPELVPIREQRAALDALTVDAVTDAVRAAAD